MKGGLEVLVGSGYSNDTTVLRLQSLTKMFFRSFQLKKGDFPNPWSRIASKEVIVASKSKADQGKNIPVSFFDDKDT